VLSAPAPLFLQLLFQTPRGQRDQASRYRNWEEASALGPRRFFKRDITTPVSPMRPF